MLYCKPKYSIPWDVSFVILDTPFLPSGAGIREHAIVAYLYKRQPWFSYVLYVLPGSLAVSFVSEAIYPYLRLRVG